MKKALTYLSCIFACCLLFVYSPLAVSAGVQGFYIWRDALLPALLPFFVCAYIMQNIAMPSKLDSAALILLSLISGAPSGARLLSMHNEADSRSAAILNNVSPMFIYASFCTGMLGVPALAIPVLAAQFGAAFIMMLIFPPKLTASRGPIPYTPPLKLLAQGISAGMLSMLNICGALVFFMALMAVIRQILPLPGGIIGAVLSGMLEMVSGCTELAGLSLSFRAAAAVSAFIFSFGGVCIFAQSLTFCQLSPLIYFSTKLVQGAIASLIAWLIALLFPSALAVYNSIPPHAIAANALSFLQVLGVSSVAMAAVMLIGAAARHRKFFGGNTQKAAE